MSCFLRTLKGTKGGQREIEEERCWLCTTKDAVIFFFFKVYIIVGTVVALATPGEVNCQHRGSRERLDGSEGAAGESSRCLPTALPTHSP